MQSFVFLTRFWKLRKLAMLELGVTSTSLNTIAQSMMKTIIRGVNYAFDYVYRNGYTKRLVYFKGDFFKHKVRIFLKRVK